VRLLSDDQPASLALRLELSEEVGRLAMAATLASGGATRSIVPVDGDGAPASWRPPGRAALLPPLVAILMALLFRRVLLALFTGILVGAVLLAAAEPGTGPLAAFGQGLWNVFATYLAQELTDTFRIEILGFVVALVATVGVMSRAGGVQGMVELLLRFAHSVRSTLVVTWGMGLLIFFDDYANCLLVGSTMRPLTDRLRISREKLAYIVDSTAAPIAGLSLLSTWIAFEVSTYSAQLPGVGITESAYAVFIQTIPYRFYCLFTLMFVGLTIFTGRDYGPMLSAERRARSTGDLVRKGGTPLVSEEATRIEPKPGLPLDWRLGAFPIAVVLLVTMLRIFVDGGGVAVLQDDASRLLTTEGITGILYDGSGAGPIFVGSLCGLLLAVWMAAGSGLRWALGSGTLVALLLNRGALVLALGEMPAALTPGAFGGWVAGLVGEDAAGYVAWLGPIALVTAIVLPLTRRRPTRRAHLEGREISRAGFSSVRALFFAVLILLQAWMIGAVCTDIKTADYLVALTARAVSPVTLPALLFVVSGLVALATGSSWSTMSILLPNVVALAAAVGAAHPLGSTFLVVVCIGAVLEGSILGDHCSPISDTTVLSSVSSASDHGDHVRTQMPYALTCGALAIGVGYLPSVAFGGWTWPMAVGTALAVMLVVLLLLGRKTPPAPQAARP
jgi:Na+/H+ antiporter NhaC